MKLPAKDDHNKRMGTTTETQGGRDIKYEYRETSMLGNGSPRPLMVDKAVQIDIMDFNETPEYNGGASFNNTFNSPVSIEPIITNEWSPAGMNETVPLQRKESTDDIIKKWKRELSIEGKSDAVPQQQPPPPNNNEGPRYKMNESDPHTPPPSDHNNTNAWPLRDSERGRLHSGSEDIEKMEDDAGKFDDEGECTEAKTQWNQGPQDGDAGPSRNRSGKTGDSCDQPEEDGDCCIQLLSYAIQCCECTIS